MSAPHPLNQAVIAQALHDLRNGQLRRCKAMGFGEEELDALKHPELVSMLVNATVSWCSVSVNREVLKRLLSQIQVSYGAISALDGLAGVTCGGAFTSGFETPVDLSAKAKSIVNLLFQPAVYEQFVAPTATSPGSPNDLGGLTLERPQVGDVLGRGDHAHHVVTLAERPDVRRHPHRRPPHQGLSPRPGEDGCGPSRRRRIGAKRRLVSIHLP